MSSHPSSLDKFLVAKPDILTFPSNCDFDLFGHRTPTLLAQSLFEQLQLQGIADGANFLPAVPGAKVSLELKFKLRDFSVGTTCSSPATFAFSPRKLTQSTPSKYPLSFLSELDAELALLKTPPKPPSSSLLEELHADSEEEFGADAKKLGIDKCPGKDCRRPLHGCSTFDPKLHPRLADALVSAAKSGSYRNFHADAKLIPASSYLS